MILPDCLMSLEHVERIGPDETTMAPTRDENLCDKNSFDQKIPVEPFHGLGLALHFLSKYPDPTHKQL